MDDDIGWDAEWESGPFCEHWSAPADCDELCACGHKCRVHDDGGCNGSNVCKCTAFDGGAE